MENREFIVGDWIGVEGLEDEAVRQVEAVEFGHNVILIKKRGGGGEKDSKYLDRYYRMASFVEGYDG